MTTDLTCANCKRTLPAQAFARSTARPSGRGVYCRACKRDYSREWYRRNKAEQGARVAANTKLYIERNRAFVNEVKAEPCQDCGHCFDPEVMEFDHDRGEKRQTISDLVRRASSTANIADEIAKCDLVCANCHRLRTKSRRLGK